MMPQAKRTEGISGKKSVDPRQVLLKKYPLVRNEIQPTTPQ